MSEVKVNKISPRSGTEVTLGDSGDTFTIPSGATINNQGTATNFGATGSASWNTTVKTGDFTAVAGEGYFVDTTSQEIDVTLPAGTAGAVVAVKDYASKFATNNCIIIPNGSEKIGGSTNNATLDTAGLAVTFIYIDSTQGWLVTDDGLQSVANTNPYMVATGGTETESGNCKIHTFTGPGTFQVTKTATAAADNIVSYMVVAGGGSGGRDVGGGGGAGGFREVISPSSPYTGSPLNGYPTPGNRITVTTAAPYPITIGAGATVPAPGSQFGNNGNPSVFSTIVSTAGGRGGGGPAPLANKLGNPGGSGGGGGGWEAPGSPDIGAKGLGNTPPVSPAQGFDGGEVNPGGPGWTGAGGGGATAVGVNGTPSPLTTFVAGGAGATTSITASPVTYAFGGTGGGDQSTTGNTTVAPNNSGGGGGGAGNYCSTNAGNAGGSGIIVIRYRFK